MLTTLIRRTDKTYGIGLNEQEHAKVYWTIKQRHGQQLNDVAASTLIDEVLAATDSLRAKPKGPQNVYAGMKTVLADVDVDACPRCSSRTRDALLVGNRRVRYCQACAIALPVKHA